jgi:hypothetical protein
MRLLTIYKNLISNNSVAQFQNNLEDDLTINPNSKLALVSANIKYNDTFIVINQFNNLISQFITKTNIDRNRNPVVVEISQGKYTISQWLEELQQAFNSSFFSNTANDIQAGLSVNVFINDKDRFSIQYSRNNVAAMTPTPNDATKINVSTTTNPKSITRTDNTLTYSGFAQMTQTPINKGSGRHNFTTVSVGANQKFILGIINEKIDLTTQTELNKEDYTVYISNDNAQNRYEINGVVSSKAVATDDAIQILINFGKVEFYIDGQLIPNETEYRDNLGKKDNFLYCSLKGQNTQIGFSSYRSDPFFIAPPLNNNLGVNPAGTYLKLSFIQPLTNSILWQLLGFSSPEITLSSVVSTFIAQKALDFEVEEDSGVNIVAENLKLSSYNFSESVEKSQSILHCIPEGLRDSNGVISYVSGNLIKIDLNNKYPLNIRNLRLSIRNAKDNSIISADEVSMAIIILEKDE